MHELERLFDIIIKGDLDDGAYDRAIARLKTYGSEPEIVDLCFLALGLVGRSLTRQIALAEVLIATRARQRRILALLFLITERDPNVGAEFIAEYGDPQAVPMLRDTLTTIEPGDPHKERDEWILAFCDAIETLGGALTFDELDRMSAAATTIFGGVKVGAPRDADTRRLVAELKELVAIEQAPPRPNALCWCGSGRKYKTCHRPTDTKSPAEPAAKTVH